MKPVRLKHIRHIVLDMDGTIYLGNQLFPCTRPFLKRLDELGITRSFVTNNSSHSANDYANRLRAMGIEVDADSIVTSGHAMIEFIQLEQPAARRLFVLGTPSLKAEMQSAGFSVVEVSGGQGDGEPDAVVVGFDTSLNYENLCQAAWWIRCGKPFLATHPDRVCPAPGPVLLPDCGAICACLSHATGRQPDVVLGKPDPRMLRCVVRRHGIAAEQLAVVGDRLYTDIQMARTTRALGVLVLTGETTQEQADAARPRPDLVVADLGELGELLKQASD